MAARITQLETLNQMLSTVGSSPIVSLDNPQNADALMATSILTTAVQEIQTEKWWFNSEENYPLTPDVNGEIIIAKNITHVDYTGRFGDYRDVVIRGDKLYDKANHTFQFDKTLYVNIRLSLDFDEIPEVAKQYASAKACRKFQDHVLDDPTTHRWTQEDEARVRGRVVAENIRQMKPSFGLVERLDPTVEMDFRKF